jgi:hypothetical protein
MDKNSLFLFLTIKIKIRYVCKRRKRERRDNELFSLFFFFLAVNKIFKRIILI